MNTSVAVRRISSLLFRAEAVSAMVTSFGSLRERPLLVVEIEDRDGARGWGEIWCNFPALAAERRARFAEEVVAPFLRGRVVDAPDVGRLLDAKFGIQAIQAGEEGLLASVSAGVDQALWDLVARRSALPLWRLFGGRQHVQVYASGIEPRDAVEMVAQARQGGHLAFKLKLGFDDRTDVNVVSSVRRTFGDSITLMVDANQAWSPRHAFDIACRIAEHDLLWLEEPIRATEAARVWRELAERSPIPLAAGENIRSNEDFKALVTSGSIRHIQPDVGKWGGITGCVGLGRWAVRSRLAYSPHWAGGGVGLAHSLNALAAVGGEGRAEIDVTPNILRDRLFSPTIVDGAITLSDEPGMGFVPNFDSLAAHRVDES